MVHEYHQQQKTRSVSVLIQICKTDKKEHDKMEENTELKAFLLEGATRLKAFCDKHNVTISPYQTPSEAVIRRMFEVSQDDPELAEICINANVDKDNPDEYEALYQGFKTGFIMYDFNEFMEHAVNEIKAFRKKTRKGRKHFNFERNPDYVLALLNGK